MFRGFGSGSFEFDSRLVELALRQESTTEGHAGRQMGRVSREPGAADANRVVQPARPPVLFGELCEGD